MIDRLSGAPPMVRFLVGAGSFLLSLGIWVVLWQSVTFAGVIMLSFLLHELGHLVAFRRQGVKAGIVFLFMGAVTYSLNRNLEDTFLTDYMWVIPAGVLTNLAIGIAAFFSAANPLWYLVAFLNFFIAFFNLAPYSTADGGKLVTAITYLFRTKRSEAADWLIIIAETVAITGALFLAPVIKNDFLVRIFIVMMFGSDLIPRLMRAYRHDVKPDPKGLTERQAVGWAAFYLALIIISLAGLIFLPTPVI